MTTINGQDETTLKDDDFSMTGGNEQALDISSDLIRGHINTIILRSLYDEDKYGYDIMEEIEKKSGGLYKLKPPTLYSALKRLESLGYVSSYAGEFSNGGRRKYFHLTEDGRTVAKRSLSEWEFSRTIIDSLISDGDSHYDFSFITEKQQELTELKRSLAAREKALEDEKASLAKLRNEVQRERSLIATQSSTLSSQKTDLSEFKEKIEAQKAELAEKELALSEKQGIIDAKEIELAEKEREIGDAKTALAELEEKIEVLRAELTEKTAALEEAQSRARSQTEDLDEMQTALASLQQDYVALKSKYNALQESKTEETTARSDALNDIERKLLEKQAEINALQAELETKTLVLEQREKSLTIAQMDLSEKTSQYYQLLSKIESDKKILEMEKTELISKRKQLDDEESERHTAFVALQMENERLQTALSAYENDAVSSLEELKAKEAELEEAQKRLAEQKAELDGIAYELEQREMRLEERLREADEHSGQASSDKAELLRLQSETLEKQELLRRQSEQIKYDTEVLQQQQKELAARLTIFNQQQMEFLERKNALASQQFDYADKFGAYNAQLKHFNEMLAKFESDKAAFLAEVERHELAVKSLQEERAAFESQREATQRAFAETEKKNAEYADALKSKNEELERKIAALREQLRLQDERELSYHTARREQAATAQYAYPYTQPQPAPQPAYGGYYPQQTQMETKSFDYADLERRAQADGIRLNTAGTIDAPRKATEQKADRPTFHKGATLFKSALVVFCFILAESLAVFFLKDLLEIPPLYPAIPFIVGFLFFIGCAIAYALGYKPQEKLPKRPSYIVTAMVLFVIAVIGVTMFAVYARAELALIPQFMSFVAIPVAYLLNVVFFAVFYYLFSKTKPNK